MKKLLSILLTAVMLCSMLAVFTVPASAASNKFVTGNVEITGNESYYQIGIQPNSTLTLKSGASVTATILSCAGNLVIEPGATLTVQGGISNLKVSSIKVDGKMTLGEVKGAVLNDITIEGNIEIGENGIIEVIKNASGEILQYFKSYCDKMNGNYTVIQKSHSIDNGKCSRCGRYTCDINEESHTYQNGKCTKCGFVCQNDFHKDYKECPECKMKVSHSVGSVFSDGGMTIIAGFAGILIGMAVMFLIMKKKKAVTANGAAEEKSDGDDEE